MLNLDVEGQIQIDVRSLVGESIAVLGIKGSGKTNTAAVLIEEFLSHGLPMAIVDIEGEYWGLKQKYDVFVIGHSENTDIEVSTENVAAFAEFSLQHKVSLILDVSEFDDDQRNQFLATYFTRLWEVASKEKTPYHVVLEEAHEFIPQSATTPLKAIFTRIALRGRKRGLGMVLVSQRSAKVDKDVLTQAGVAFLHRVVHPIDVERYVELLPLPAKDVRLSVPAMERGQVIALLNNSVCRATIRPRHTFHVGATPELLQEARTAVQNRADESRLSELRALLSGKAASEDDNLADLRQQIVEKDKTIQALCRYVDELEFHAWIPPNKSKMRQIIPSYRIRNKAVSMPVAVTPDTPVISPLPPATQAPIDVLIPPATGDNLPQLALLDKPATAGNQRLEQYRATRNQDLINRQQKAFSQLLAGLVKLPRMYRMMLAFLVGERKAASAIEIARYLGLSDEAFLKNPPFDLLNLKLITRLGKGRKTQYQAINDAELQNRYPLLDLNTMRAKLEAQR